MQKFIFALSSILLLSCNHSSDQSNPQLSEGDNLKNSNPLQASLVPYERIAEDLTEDDCDREEPAALLNESYFTNHTFDLADNNTASETAHYPNGDKIYINYSGCENRKIDIRITSFTCKGKSDDMKYWNSELRTLIKEIKFHSNSDYDIELKNEIDYLSEYLMRHPLTIKKEIKYSNEDAKNSVLLDEIEEGISNSKIIHLTISLNE